MLPMDGPVFIFLLRDGLPDCDSRQTGRKSPKINLKEFKNNCRTTRWAKPQHAIQVRALHLGPDERRILGEGASPIELTAKAFDLLVLLVSKAEQLVTKDEILDAVWQEVSIAESNVTTTISMIRKALQEDSEHRYIETVPKKGYRFVACCVPSWWATGGGTKGA
jgi:DNA-binding winged helix-turn-helix (wHTH) protein